MNRDGWLTLFDDLAAHAIKEDGIVRIGVTGTRKLNGEGKLVIDRLIQMLVAWSNTAGVEVEIVHGGCLGVDTRTGMTAKMNGLRVHTILPEERRWVPEYWKSCTDTWEEGGDYRQRNKKIVQRTQMLFAIPDYPEDDTRSRRSGTWMCVRLAREAMKPVMSNLQHD